MADSIKRSPGGIDDTDALRRLDKLIGYVSGDYNDLGDVRRDQEGARRR